MPDSPKVFLVRAGKQGQDEEYCLEHDVAVIGFTEVPSLAAAQDYDAILKIFTNAQPDAKPRTAGNYAGQLWAFALGMREGDIVVLPRKLTSQIAIGKVAGPYKFAKVGDSYRHTRGVKWIRPDVARTTFDQDLLHSFGAFMTVCQVRRNDAERRVAAVLAGQQDPGYAGSSRGAPPGEAAPEADAEDLPTDLSEAANDQIVAHIQKRFTGHRLSHLVDAVLRADGWVTQVSPPGPDGGVDILGGRGPLGLDEPRLCVQVKSQTSPCDVTVYRTLQGSMQTFKAVQGLLVCWGGFNKAVRQEAKQNYFTVRLWESRDLVEAIYRNYEKLSAEIQAELPLKQAWMLVVEDLPE